MPRMSGHAFKNINIFYIYLYAASQPLASLSPLPSCAPGRAEPSRRAGPRAAPQLTRIGSEGNCSNSRSSLGIEFYCQHWWFVLGLSPLATGEA